MNIVVLLRPEIICIGILAYIIVGSMSREKEENSRKYMMIYLSALGYVLLDGITIYTVNHLEEVPEALNHICHIGLFLSATYFSMELMRYVIGILYPSTLDEVIKKFIKVGYVVFSITYFVSFMLIPLYYVTGKNSNYSDGPALIIGFGFPVLFFLTTLILIGKNWKKLPSSARKPLVSIMITLLVTIAANGLIHELLLTGGGITISTLIVYISLENAEYTSAIRRISEQDALTHLYNRGAGEKKIRELLQTECGMFCLFDVDNFKQANDLFGHTVGDEVLYQISKCVYTLFQEKSVIMRLGGDEFAIFSYEIQSRQEGRQKLDEFMKRVKEIVIDGAEGHRLSVSLGAVIYQQDADEDFDSLYRKADLALYKVKKQGKGNYEFYQDEPD